MKTSELTGAALDWAVAKCEGHRVDPAEVPVKELANSPYIEWDEYDNFQWVVDEYSTDWAQGGPIIEREGVDICTSTRGGWIATLLVDCEDSEVVRGEGETALVAAMRCYVASKLGDEVDVPEELTK